MWCCCCCRTAISTLVHHCTLHGGLDRAGWSQGRKDGAFLATFGKGAIGRTRSESRPAFVSKLMHEHLATEGAQRAALTPNVRPVARGADSNRMGNLACHRPRSTIM